MTHHSIKEIQRRIFELTLALYRVTDFFPQGEALRKQFREKANEIFSSVSEYEYTDDREYAAVVLSGKLQAIKGYCAIARSMQWVKPINIVILEREYDIIASFFEKEIVEVKQVMHQPTTAVVAGVETVNVSREKTETVEQKVLPQWEQFSSVEEKNVLIEEKQPDPVSYMMNERQQKILDHLRRTEKARVSDFFSYFGEVSSKTIQRDLQDLVAKSVLKKEGEKRWTLYYLNSVL